MPDAADAAAFLTRYIADGDAAGVRPPLRELAALVESIGEADAD